MIRGKGPCQEYDETVLCKENDKVNMGARRFKYGRAQSCPLRTDEERFELEAARKMRKWIPDIFLVASLVPVIPQVMELAEDGVSPMSSVHVQRLTALAISSIVLSSIYLWLAFRHMRDKAMRYYQAFAILGTPIILLPLSLDLVGERVAPGGAIIFALLGAMFVLVAFVDYYLRKRKSLISSMFDYAVSGGRLCLLYLLTLSILITMMFILIVESAVWPNFDYFWQDMGESWIRPLYSMGLLFSALMAFVLTAVSTKLGTTLRTAAPRLVILAILIWLCIEADDLIEYYTW